MERHRTLEISEKWSDGLVCTHTYYKYGWNTANSLYSIFSEEEGEGFKLNLLIFVFFKYVLIL